MSSPSVAEQQQPISELTTTDKNLYNLLEIVVLIISKITEINPGHL